MTERISYLNRELRKHPGKDVLQTNKLPVFSMKLLLPQWLELKWTAVASTKLYHMPWRQENACQNISAGLQRN